MKRVFTLFSVWVAAAICAAMLTLSAYAQLTTRVLTIRTFPSDIELKTVFVDGKEAKIVANQAGYAFVEIRDEASAFRCKYTISVIAKNGRFARKQFDLCEELWQINFSFEDDGAGASQKQISIVPSKSDVRIYSLSIDGKPQSFTAFMDSNRVEFTLRRGPSGYKCAVRLEVLLSTGKTFADRVDLCANNDEVVIELDQRDTYYEIFTVRTDNSDDRISGVKVDGRRVPVLRWITQGVRTRLAVGAGSFSCDAKVDVEFASGAKASDKVDICAENFDITVTAKPQYLTDTNLGSPLSWRFKAPTSNNDLAELRFASGSRTVGFVAVCEPASRRADIYVTGFPTKAKLSGRVAMKMWAGRYQDTKNATMGRAPNGPSNAAPTMSLSTGDGLWDGMIAGSAFTLLANDNHRLRLSLKGSAAPVRDFVRACNQRFNGPSVIGDVTSDTSLKWSKQRLGNGQHRLVYGDLSTDRIGLDARCEETTGFAEVMFASAPTNMQQFTDLDIGWDTVGNRGTMFARTRNVPGIEWGTVPISKVEMRDPFWGALAAGNIVRLSVDGERMAIYSLKGSSSPIRQFVEACRAYRTPPVSDPVTPDQPREGEEVFNTIVDIFNTLSSQSNGNIKVEIEGLNAGAKRALDAYKNNPSIACGAVDRQGGFAGPAVQTAFVNRTGELVTLYEVTFDGQRLAVRDIPPGARLSVTADSGQSWEVHRQNGGCLAGFASPSRDVQFEIKPNMDRADRDAFAKTYVCNGQPTYVVLAPNHGLALIDGEYVFTRADVAGRQQNIWGDMSASISNEKLVVRGGPEDFDCSAR